MSAENITVDASADKIERALRKIDRTITIIEMLMDGHCPSIIKQRTKCTYVNISYYVKAFGLPPFPAGGAGTVSDSYKARVKRIKALKQDGFKQNEIAQMLQVSRQRINQILHPDRKRARNIVADRILRGRMKRPSVCSKCRALGEVQAHHPNHARPLVIEWLCHNCHVERTYQNGSAVGVVTT